MWKLDYLRFFWNYLDINYVFQSICNLWALCGFNTMPCVISRWSPDLVFVVFVTTESNPGHCPFTLDDTFFPTVMINHRFFSLTTTSFHDWYLEGRHCQAISCNIKEQNETQRATNLISNKLVPNQKFWIKTLKTEFKE